MLKVKNSVFKKKCPERNCPGNKVHPPTQSTLTSVYEKNGWPLCPHPLPEQATRAHALIVLKSSWVETFLSNATKFVLLIVFSYMQTICQNIWVKTLPKKAKYPLLGDLRCSETSLLKLPVVSPYNWPIWFCWASSGVHMEKCLPCWEGEPSYHHKKVTRLGGLPC